MSFLRHGAPVSPPSADGTLTAGARAVLAVCDAEIDVWVEHHDRFGYEFIVARPE